MKEPHGFTQDATILTNKTFSEAAGRVISMVNRQQSECEVRAAIVNIIMNFPNIDLDFNGVKSYVLGKVKETKKEKYMSL